MKKLLTLIACSFLLFTSCSDADKPKEIATFVYDQAEVMNPEEEKKIDSLLRAHEKTTSNEVALLTISDYGVDKDLKTYATNFMNRNGIGKKEKDNGVLIVYNPGKHEVRISTGYGAEKVLNDDAIRNIITNIMIPEFQNENNFNGLWLGCKAVVDFLDKPENIIPEK